MSGHFAQRNEEVFDLSVDREKEQAGFFSSDFRGFLAVKCCVL